MITFKQSARAGAVMVVGLAFLLLGLVPLAWAGEAATPKETIQAAQTKAAATLAAVKTDVPRTATAFRATAVAMQNGLRATGTAYRLTSTVLLLKLKTTGTAVQATWRAGATGLNATVVAVKTSVATRLAPVTDPTTAITYYAINVLGLQVTVEEARKATSSDAATLTQTDIGAQIQRSAVTYAGVSYYGKLSNGAATLSYSLGVVRDEALEISLAGASAAVYSLKLENTGPLDASSALGLAQATFPKIAKFTYVPWATQRGWAWRAALAQGVADTRTVRGGAGWIMLYLLPGTGGTARVSATVVVGGFLPLAPK